MSKVKVTQIETHVTDACNLKCEKCTHFSQEGHSGRETVDSFRAHNEPWSKRLDPRFFLVLGGEPTLNPDLVEILIEARRLWQDAEIRLVTNGFFLHRFPMLAEVLPGCRIRLDVSIHHDDPRYLAKLQEVKELCAGWGVPIAWRESFRDWKAYYQGEGKDARPFDDKNLQASWGACESKWCMTIKNGLLYKCPMTAHLQDHVRKFGDDCGTCRGTGDVEDYSLVPEGLTVDCPDCKGNRKSGWAPYLDYKPLEPTCTDAEMAEFTSRKAESCCGMCPANPQHLSKPYPVRERSNA